MTFDSDFLAALCALSLAWFAVGTGIVLASKRIYRIERKIQLSVEFKPKPVRIAVLLMCGFVLCGLIGVLLAVMIMFLEGTDDI